MDVGMAELNGIDAARQIHETAARTVRVVMLSMHEDQPVRVRGPARPGPPATC